MKSETKIDKVFDVVVIGGGPAGMMAAGRSAEVGKERSVLLLEKNGELGKKLLITGGGRCNVTNNTTDVRAMLTKYKDAGKFLFSSFSQFAVTETIRFFNDRGMQTKEEAGGRMFPASNKAQSVYDTLVSYMSEGKVQIKTNATVTSISLDKTTKYFHIKLKEGQELVAKSCIVATGGTSRPETGSTGEGFKWLKNLGHTIIENNFALVPIALSDTWVKKLGGVTLSDVKLTIFQDGKRQERSGLKKTRHMHADRILFTHFGISGPTVLNMSREVGELLQYGDVEIHLDLFPKLDLGALKNELQKLLVSESNKKIKNSLSLLFPTAFVTPVLNLAGIDGEMPNHSVRSEDRKKLVLLLKSIPLHVKGLFTSKAVISSGGVALEEVNFKTMESRKVKNLYVVGDTLNIDRPSGGYSLQLCWTTGYVAGSHV